MLPVTVVIPCFNAAATLARTLDSCLAQPQAAQILIADDASTDLSADIARAYAARDSRVVLLTMPHNGGAANARNWAAMHAAYAVLAFIDADDEFMPAALAAATAFLQQHPHQASVRLDVDYVGFPDELTTHPQFNMGTTTLSNTVPTGLVIRRAAFAALGGFPDDALFRQQGGEDGAFSWALRDAFGNPRLTDCKRVRMHYHAGIHAERFLRVTYGWQTPDADTLERLIALSRETATAAVENVISMRALAVTPLLGGPSAD